MAARLNAFLHDWVRTVAALYELEWGVRERNLLGQWREQVIGRHRHPEQERHWQEFTAATLARFPDADDLALEGLLQHAERERIGSSMQGPGHWTPAGDLCGLLALWVTRRPAPGAADRVLRDLEQGLGLSPRGWLSSLLGAGARQHPAIPVYALALTLAGLEAREKPPYTRCIPLLVRLMERHSQQKGETDRETDQVMTDLIWALGPYLNQTPALADLTETVLLINPRLLTRRSGGEGLKQAVLRVLNRALTAEPDTAIHSLIEEIKCFEGIDHLLAACRQLDRFPQAKPPLPGDGAWYNLHAHLRWPQQALLLLAAPGATDRDRAAELAQVSRSSLLMAAVLSPRWAGLIEPCLQWPGLGALIDWCRLCGEATAWKSQISYSGERPMEESELEGGLDRTVVTEAVALMGPKRLADLKKLPAFRKRYREALVCLEACLGENAADVEAGFAKRNKTAVRALGLLPAEDDVLDRYLALRRFAKEARQFGPQRQASETKAAEDALDNLALTAGYSDRAALEWAMEAKLAESMDPTSRRWVIEGYTVWLEPDEKATIAVDREGKRLKSVPPAVRQSPGYAEVKEAREMLQAQWDRVLRRLESSMARGEVMDRAAFAPAFTTPAGRAMVPGLVLRCWLPGAAASVETLGMLRLDGTPLEPDTVERYQVAHPLHLAASGTLEAWQRRLTELRVTQPFAQLFREIYASRDARRQLEGRKVRLGALVERLRRSGWKRDSEGSLLRPLGARQWVSLWFSDGAAWMEATAVLTVDQLHLPDQCDPQMLSEALREADLATAHACPDRTSPPESREVLAARAALDRLRPQTKGSRRMPV